MISSTFPRGEAGFWLKSSAPASPSGIAQQAKTSSKENFRFARAVHRPLGFSRFVPVLVALLLRANERQTGLSRPDMDRRGNVGPKRDLHTFGRYALAGGRILGRIIHFVLNDHTVAAVRCQHHSNWNLHAKILGADNDRAIGGRPKRQSEGDWIAPDRNWIARNLDHVQLRYNLRKNDHGGADGCHTVVELKAEIASVNRINTGASETAVAVRTNVDHALPPH